MSEPKPSRLLEIKNVIKTFGAKKALDALSLTLEYGEWLGLLGESGSGKSTLLRIIARLEDGESGEVIFKQNKLPPVGSQLMPGQDEIKLVNQDYDLFPNQTVAENIMHAMGTAAEDYKKYKTEEIIEILALETVRDQRIKILSDGEKQRTAMACALISEPKLILLDEPFAHLDNLNRQRLSEALGRMRHKKRVSCILVSHDPAELMQWADRIFVMRGGHIIQDAPPKEVYQKPVDVYVAELSGRINWLDKRKKSFVRPEKIRFTTQEMKAKWQGVVSSAIYKGHFWEYEALGTQGIRFVFFRSSPALKEGDRVLLTWADKELRSVS